MQGNSGSFNRFAIGILVALPAAFIPQVQAGAINLPIGTDVTVTNPSLPVTGSVTVANTTANPVPVTITGGVTLGATSVNVLNSTLNVADVNNPAYQAYAAALPGGEACASQYVFASFPAVPQGKTLVVEMVSLNFHTPAGTFGSVTLGSSLPAYGTTYQNLLVQQQGTDGVNNYYVASQAVKVYNGPGAAVSIQASASPGAGYKGSDQVCVVSGTLSGYLVSAP